MGFHHSTYEYLDVPIICVLGNALINFNIMGQKTEVFMKMTCNQGHHYMWKKYVNEVFGVCVEKNHL